MRRRQGLWMAGAIMLAGVTASPAAGQVVISEFRTRGPAGGNDEFIELYNAGLEPVDIGGYKVKGSNSSGTIGVRATIPAGTVMGPRTFYLLVNTGTNGYSGTVTGDLTYTTGIVDNGGIALTTPDDVVVDAVGLSTGSAFYEGAPLSPMSQTKEQSYERKTATCGPDQDSDDNASDFQYNDGSSSPQNSSSCRLACAGDPCVTPPEPVCQDAGTSIQYGTGTCEAGHCVYVPEEVPCEFGCNPQDGLCRPDPCEGVVCDGPPNDQCYEATGTCVAGACEYTPLVEETPCDDGDLCTEGDQCDGAGACTGSPKFCYLPDPECLDPDTSRLYTGGACDPATGDCVFEHLDTTCEFGCDEATGLCANDPCAGVVCNDPPNDQCYEATGACVGGVCEYTPLAEGTACDDGDLCTLSDGCDADGGCVGTPVVCDAPPNMQCYEATGTCVGGVCQYAPLAEETACDDGDLCTESDACDADHLCVGAPKVCAAVAPICTDAQTSFFVLDPSCDPADGTCRGSEYVMDCAGLGCDEALGSCNRLPVISQFRTRGPAGGNDEFVEVFNPSAFDVDISGWTLRGSSATGTVGVRATVPPGTVMGPRTFFLFVNTASNGYSGTVAGDLTYGTGIADTGGVALADADGAVVDAVGMSEGSAYLEGMPLAATTVNQDQAYERKTLACGPDRDLGDNASDFTFLMASHPRNIQSCRVSCAGDPCVTPPDPWCQDEGTLMTYPGAECLDGVCHYSPLAVTCDFGCDAGACKPDPCAGVVCDEPPNDQCYEATGACVEGVCEYTRFDTGSDCDDGDACTETDYCHPDGTCAGGIVVCPAKSPECLDADTSRTYAPGLCDPATGDCLYAPTDTTCDFGCDNATGLCLGDPCAGVVCDDPPSACHASQGTCVGGTCSYEPLDAGAACDDGDSCTQDDQCDGTGTCEGTPIACNQPPGPCFLASGACEDGACVYAPLAQGSPCDDLDPCTHDDQCDGGGTCVGTPDPDCVTPPEQGGEDTGAADTTPGPDAVADPGAEGVSPADEAPDIAGGDQGGSDFSTSPDAVTWPDAVQEGVVSDTAGRDVGTDAGAPPKKGGGGSCSSSGASSSGWWLVLVGLGAWAAATRRRRAPV